MRPTVDDQRVVLVCSCFVERPTASGGSDSMHQHMYSFSRWRLDSTVSFGCRRTPVACLKSSPAPFELTRVGQSCPDENSTLCLTFSCNLVSSVCVQGRSESLFLSRRWGMSVMFLFSRPWHYGLLWSIVRDGRKPHGLGVHRDTSCRMR